MRYRLLLTLALAGLLAAGMAGCGGAPTPAFPAEAVPGDTPPPGEAGVTIQPSPVPTGTPTPGAGLEAGGATREPVPLQEPAAMTPPAGAEEAVRLAQEDLAGRLGMASADVQLVSVEAVEWSDTSLGCPQPGMMYAQVITPGYRVVLEAGGQTYTYHTDEGRFVVSCEEASGTQ